MRRRSSREQKPCVNVTASLNTVSLVSNRRYIIVAARRSSISNSDAAADHMSISPVGGATTTNVQSYEEQCIET